MSGPRALGALLASLFEPTGLLNRRDVAALSIEELLNVIPTQAATTTTTTVHTTETVTLAGFPALASAARDLVSDGAAVPAVLAAFAEQANDSFDDFAGMVQETWAWYIITYPLQYEWVSGILGIMVPSILFLLLLQFGGLIGFLLFESGKKAIAPAPAPTPAPVPTPAHAPTAATVAVGSQASSDGNGDSNAAAGNVIGMDAAAIEARIAPLERMIRQAIDSAANTEGNSANAQRQTISTLGRVLNDVQRLHEQSEAQATSVQALADELVARDGERQAQTIERICAIVEQVAGSIEASKAETRQTVNNLVESWAGTFNETLDGVLASVTTTQTQTQEIDNRCRTAIQRFQDQVNEKIQTLQNDIKPFNISEEERARLLQDLTTGLEIEKLLGDLMANFRREFNAEIEKARCTCSASPEVNEHNFGQRLEAASKEVDDKINDMAKNLGDQLTLIWTALTAGSPMNNADLDQRFEAAAGEVRDQLRQASSDLTAQINQSRCNCPSTTVDSGVIDDRIEALRSELVAHHGAELAQFRAQGTAFVQDLIDENNETLQEILDDIVPRLDDVEFGLDAFTRVVRESSDEEKSKTRDRFKATYQGLARINREFQSVDERLAQTNTVVNGLTQRQRERDSQRPDAEVITSIEQDIQALNRTQATTREAIHRLNLSDLAARGNMAQLRTDAVTQQDLSSLQDLVTQLGNAYEELQRAQQQLQERFEEQDQRIHPSIERPQSERPQSERPQSERPQSERPQSERPQSERPQSERPQSERPQSERPESLGLKTLFENDGDVVMTPPDVPPSNQNSQQSAEEPQPDVKPKEKTPDSEILPDAPAAQTQTQPETQPEPSTRPAENVVQPRGDQSEDTRMDVYPTPPQSDRQGQGSPMDISPLKPSSNRPDPRPRSPPASPSPAGRPQPSTNTSRGQSPPRQGGQQWSAALQSHTRPLTRPSTRLQTQPASIAPRRLPLPRPSTGLNRDRPAPTPRLPGAWTSSFSQPQPPARPNTTVGQMPPPPPPPPTVTITSPSPSQQQPAEPAGTSTQEMPRPRTPFSRWEIPLWPAVNRPVPAAPQDLPIQQIGAPNVAYDDPFTQTPDVVNTGGRPGTPLPQTPSNVAETGPLGGSYDPLPSRPSGENEEGFGSPPAPPPPDDDGEDHTFLLGSDEENNGGNDEGGDDEYHDDGNDNEDDDALFEESDDEDDEEVEGPDLGDFIDAPGALSQSGGFARPYAIPIMPAPADPLAATEPEQPTVTPSTRPRRPPRTARSQRERFSQSGSLPNLPAPSPILPSQEPAVPAPPTQGYWFPGDVPTSLLNLEANDPGSPQAREQQQRIAYQFNPSVFGTTLGELHHQYGAVDAPTSAPRQSSGPEGQTQQAREKPAEGESEVPEEK